MVTFNKSPIFITKERQDLKERRIFLTLQVEQEQVIYTPLQLLRSKKLLSKLSQSERERVYFLAGIESAEREGPRGLDN